MLTLSVRVGQSVRIGDTATVTVLDKSGQNVRLGIDADKSIPIQRLDGPAPRGTSWGLTGKPEPALEGTAAK